MTIRELNEKIRKINSHWLINYSENIDYVTDTDGVHRVTIRIYDNEKDVYIVKFGIGTDCDTYIQFGSYEAYGKREILDFKNLIIVLEDYLDGFKGYIN